MAIPPPPVGFTIDKPNDIPPPPSGFTIDKPQKPSLLDRLGEYMKQGSYLPTAGAVVGGVAGSELGPGAMGTAALGASGGEAIRQLIARAQGKPSPQTSLEAAKGIGMQGALGAAGEGGGQILGKLGKMAFKGLPNVAQAFSGSPARNFAKAEQRGLIGTYFPKIARGISRQEAGLAQGAIEDRVFSRYFSPKEQVAITMNSRGAADEAVTKALVKMKMKIPLSGKEAISAVKGVDTLMPAETAKNAPRAASMARLRRYANDILARAEPEYAQAKKVTEATILRSQLSKPMRVQRTNPDVMSGFTGAIAPIAGSLAGYESKSVLPLIAGMLGTSPLAFGVGSAALGTVRNSIPPLLRKVIQRALIQAGVQQTQPAMENRP